MKNRKDKLWSTHGTGLPINRAERLCPAIEHEVKLQPLPFCQVDEVPEEERLWRCR